MYELIEKAKEIAAMPNDTTEYDSDSFDERVIEHYLRQVVTDAKRAYDRILYREVIKRVLYELRFFGGVSPCF